MYRIIGGDGVEYGPISMEQLKQWLQEGRVNGLTQVRFDGTTEWKPLNSFPELAATYAVPPPLAHCPPNYMVYSVLCTLCCCLPFGVVAIVYSAKVNDKFSRGDYEGARKASEAARLWCWVAAIVGVFFHIGTGFLVPSIFKGLPGGRF